MRSFLLIITLCVLVSQSFAQNRYRSRASGDWNNPATWQVEALPNGSNLWSNATTSPDFSASNISLRPTHIITISTPITLDQTGLNSGAVLIVNDGVSVTINDGAGTDLLIFSGASLHLLGESHLQGLGSVFLGGDLYSYSTNPTGAITAGIAATGNLRTTGRTWTSSTVIHYEGNGKQFIGSGHPSTTGVTTIINNSFGVEVNNTASTSLVMNGNLSILSGQLLVIQDNLNMGSGTTITINGGSLDFLNTSSSRVHTIRNLTLLSGSMTTSTLNGNSGLSLFVYGDINLQGGQYSMVSNVANNGLVIYGDISGTSLITSSGNFNSVNIYGSGILSAPFPFSTNSTIRQLTINRSGSVLIIPNQITFRNVTLLNGSIDCNADQIIQGSLEMASGTSLDFSDLSIQIGSAINNTQTGGLLVSNSNSVLTLNGGTTNSSTLNFDPGSVLNTLIVNRFGTVNFGSPILITNRLDLLDGTLSNTGGSLSFSNGVLFTRNSQASFTGNAPTGGPYNLIYTGTNLTAGQEALGTINNLTSNLSSTLTLSSALSIQGALTVNSGFFTAGSNAISATSLSNTGTFNAPSSTLTLSGDLSSSGTFNLGTADLVLTGTANQSISTINVNQFNDITLTKTAGTVSMNSSQSLRGVLTVSNGATFDADGVTNTSIFTLLSIGDTSGSDASIAQLGAGASVVGNVSVQRLWGAEDNDFRYISSPVTNGTVQQLRDAGIFINGYPGTDFPCGGLCNNDNANLSSYNESIAGAFNNGYTGYPGPSGDASAILLPGIGYNLFMWDGTSPTLWTATGTINQGSIPLTVTHTVSSPVQPTADGWNLVGNPYPSSIVWDEDPSHWTTDPGIDPVIWLYDEVAELWRSYNRETQTGSGFDGTIATGQAFWVYADNSQQNHTMIIHEGAKTSISGNYYRKASPEVPVLTVSLKQNDIVDEAYILEKNGRHSLKMSSGKERMSLAIQGADDSKLAYYITDRTENEIPLSVEVRDAGLYSLSFSSNVSQSYFLVDKMNNMVVPASQEYVFAISTANTKMKDRFFLTTTPMMSSLEPEKISIAVFPNPVEEELTVEVADENVVSMHLLTVTGEVVKAGKVIQADGISKSQFDVSAMPTGIYMVRVENSNKTVTVHKIIKR
ncbi:T9SS type A sorting domain-containing protein [Chryseotalea sanaruensis]|uniref:T9SS type A sorting domain-containing protein n=1 Tax=Chryseotalea sanaruensis TaxID=2482724 RepID=UPI000F8DF8D4|nr:T9SS type A sorting domain-containing protein [Chryseotalea sanaruensis]